MKKLVASVGLVALGASAVQTASAQSLAAPDNTKPWSVSAALRGFYDDNISTLPNNFTLPPGQHRDSFGFEVNPGVALAWSLETTTISVSYLYSLKYYNNKPFLSTSHDDQTHTFNAAVTHKFSEQTEGRVSDSFVVGQEPDMLRAGPTMATFQRIPGDNIRNYGTIGLDTKLTRLFGIGLGYDNTLYDYADKGETLPPRGTPGNILPSFAGTLNRMENGAHIEPTWQLWPETKGLLGYSFRQIDYTADEFIGGTVDAGGNIAPPPGSIKSDVRDNRSHRLYVGAEHNFTPDFSGSLRGGFSYTDYFNDSNTSAKYTPYFNGTLRYLYAPESYLEGGVSYDRSPADLVGFEAQSGQFTLDSATFVIYATLNHRITPWLYGNLMAQYQNSTYNGGLFDGKVDQDYLVGLNLEYRFTPALSAEVGYNYDNLQSQIPNRHYDRNRVYIGVIARY